MATPTGIGTRAVMEALFGDKYIIYFGRSAAVAERERISVQFQRLVLILTMYAGSLCMDEQLIRAGWG